MARIWQVYEGREPTRGEPLATVSAQDAIEAMDLAQDDFVSDLDLTPRFGPTGSDLRFAGFRHTVVEFGESDAKRTGWKPGFYLSNVKPDDAFGKLVRQALEEKLGSDNVVGVAYHRTVDSQGQEALRVSVVLDPGAVERLDEDAALDAFTRLRERLQDEMNDGRMPIIEYATEAELAAADVGR